MASIKTKHDDIVEYWACREDECGLSVDWAEAHERCWRCGYLSNLERCHIVPASLGGSSDPQNLVLLCSRCHREAPNVQEKTFMWTWLRAHATPFYDTYWGKRASQEFEIIFKRKPFSELKTDVAPEHVQEVAVKWESHCSWHFGDPHLNPSTVAWLYRQIENTLEEESSVAPV